MPGGRSLNIRKLLGDYSVALGAQGTALLASVLMSFLVPRLLGVSEFGYWQLFLFYGSYVGLFLLGLNDGIYLIHGGQHREIIDRQSVSSQFAVGAGLQLVVASLMIGYALLLMPTGERRFVFVCAAIYLIVSNLSGFLGFAFQAMNETRLYSTSIMVGKVSFLVPLVVLLALRVGVFEPYVVAYLLAQSAALLYCVCRGWDLISAPKMPVRAGLAQAIISIRVGSKLMLANIAGMLILGVCRLCIDARWGISAFGEVSFSLALVSFFLMFVSQLAMVLFPALRAAEEDYLRPVLMTLRELLSLGLPVVYLLYFPIRGFLGVWIPQYEASLDLLALLLPISVFDSRMSLVATTYFKVRRRESLLLAINVTAMVVSAVGTIVAVLVFDSAFAAIAVAVASIVWRSLYSETRMLRDLHVGTNHRGGQEVVIAFLFVVCALVLPTAVGFAICVLAYACFLCVNRRAVLMARARVARIGDAIRRM